MSRATPPPAPPVPPELDAPRSRRGFASMDPARLRSVSSKGGKAQVQGPRGFARMDAERLREVARRGSQAAHRTAPELPPFPWPDDSRDTED